MANNNLDKIYDASPDDINEFISELIFQNTINVTKKNRKLSGMLYGSPGIGKTESIEKYPIWSVEKHNSAIAQKYVKLFEFTYNQSENIFEQSKKQLDKTELTDDIKNKILEDPDFKKDVFIGVVLVSQSDIIMPEDISGLPSSESDISRLNELYTLLINRQSHADKSENEKLNTYKQVLNERIDSTIGHILGDIDDIKDGITRNTTKFDFTEWEKKVWDIINAKLTNQNKNNIEHIILVLDDITRSANNNPGILNVLMPILQQARVGQRDLPKNCTVIITSNEADDTDRNESNYVMELDDAQRDRVFSKKIKFNFKDWEAHALRNDVHESVIMFFRHNPKYFQDHYITPRRATQLGQALFNKFGHDQTFICENAEVNAEFMKTLHTQLGDSKNKNYLTIMTQFVSFLRTVSSDTLNFINLLKEKGWTKDTKGMIEKFKSTGELVKISIIVHKVRELAINTELTEKQINSIIDFFNDEILPINLRYTLLESVRRMLESYQKLKSGTGDANERRAYKQIYQIASACSKSIGNEREEISIMASKRMKNKK